MQAGIANSDPAGLSLRSAAGGQEGLDEYVGPVGPPELAFFVTAAEFAELESGLSRAVAGARLDAMLALAWQLRQRDSGRAQALAALVQQGLADERPETPSTRQSKARLALIDGEIEWLQGALEPARAKVQAALQSFLVLNDVIGCADAHWLLAGIANDQGNTESMLVELERLLECVANGDEVRRVAAQAALASVMAFRDLTLTRQRWGATLVLGLAGQHPAAEAWVGSYLGLVLGLTSRSGESIQHLSDAYLFALETGQLRLAVRIACSIAAGFCSLKAPRAGLAWAMRGLSLARGLSWPVSIATALLESATALHGLQRFDEARELLLEALDLLGPYEATRLYAWATKQLGQMELVCRDGKAALLNFGRLEQAAQRLKQPDLLCHAWLGQADALRLMGQPQQALLTARKVLNAQQALLQIEASQLIAEIQSSQAESVQDGVDGKTAALRTLQSALELAQGIEGYQASGDFLEALARAYAACGEHGQAYAVVQRAGCAYQRIDNQEAGKRALAVQLGQGSEAARLAGEQRLAQAKTQAARAEALQELNQTLALLGTIGREITANLDMTAVFAAIDRHAHRLLDVSALMIFRLDPGAKGLTLVYGVEAATVLPALRFDLKDPERLVPRCARERAGIVIPDDPPRPLLFAGTRHTPSKLFEPLLVRGRLLGVMTIQSYERFAYAERELAVFRSLSAYGAIALANADALAELQHTQAQLIQQEQIASLGRLVANVAHEINTPIAVVKSSGQNIADALAYVLGHLPRLLLSLDEASTQELFRLLALSEQAKEMLSTREERELRRTLTGQLEASGIADAGRLAAFLIRLHAQAAVADLQPLLLHPQAQEMLASADSLVTMSRSIANINSAVDRVAKIVFALRNFSHRAVEDEWVETDLRESVETVLTMYQHRIKQGHDLVRRYEAAVSLLCLPDELIQVWTNLIHNALQAMPGLGQLTVGIRRQAGEVVVSITDTGCGIPAAIRPRIFEGFFTTKPFGEGSGLGLAIVQQIVDKHRGRIEVASEEGQGTCFSVILPLAR